MECMFEKKRREIHVWLSLGEANVCALWKENFFHDFSFSSWRIFHRPQIVASWSIFSSSSFFCWLLGFEVGAMDGDVGEGFGINSFACQDENQLFS